MTSAPDAAGLAAETRATNGRFVMGGGLKWSAREGYDSCGVTALSLMRCVGDVRAGSRRVVSLICAGWVPQDDLFGRGCVAI